jgi:chemotaxis protein MotB
MTKMLAPLLLAATLAMSAAACGVNEDLYNATVKDRDQQKQKLADTQKALEQEKAQHAKDVDARDARVLVLSKKLTSLGQDVSRLETERGNLGGELEQAQKRMEELRKAQAQAEERAAQFRKLVTQFKALTDAGKLQVEIRENRMIVRLGDKILFDPGKTDLKPEGKDALTQVTAVLKTLPNRNFQVAGHTDNVPIKSKKFRSNWDLSTARAVEVTNYMIGAGMEPKRLSAAGYADQSPVAPNDTPVNMAKNRRIEITLVPNLDDLPPIDEALKSDTAAAPAAAPAPATPAKPPAAPTPAS